MFRTSTFAMIALIAASAFSGVSYAASMHMNAPKNIDAMLRTFHGKLNVVTVASLDGGEVAPSVDAKTDIPALQAAIQANSHLTSELHAQSEI